MNKINPIYYNEIHQVLDICKDSQSYLIYKVTGKHAGYLGKEGYFRLGINGKYYRAHRLVYCLFHKVDLITDLVIDHIDQNKLNNSPNNLRLVTITVNNLNANLRKDSLSKVQGVRYLEAKGYSYWVARWKVDNKLKEKCFSISKHGYEKAKELATEYRNQKVSESLKKSLNR